jgi:hypothetical protein
VLVRQLELVVEVNMVVEVEEPKLQVLVVVLYMVLVQVVEVELLQQVQMCTLVGEMQAQLELM